MFVISRIEQYKFSSCAAVFAECERTLTRYDNPDYHPEKTPENIYLVSPCFSGSVDNYILQRKKDFKCRMSIDPNLPTEKQTNVMCQCLFTASPEFFRDMSRDQTVEYFQRCFDFFVERFPSVEVLSAVVHMDETTPHMHINFLPTVQKVNSKGKEKTVFSSSDLFKGKYFFGEYQDLFYEHISSLYPQKSLDRKGELNQTHLTIQEYKERQREVETLEETLDELRSEASEIESFIDEAKATPSLAVKIENAELRKQLSYYQRVSEYLLKKFPQLKPVFDYFRSSRSPDRER